MADNKGKGIKGRYYDELTGVGTSSAGPTGTTGNLNTGVRDGGIGMPSASDSGYRGASRQSADADPDIDDFTPALGRGARSQPQRSNPAQHQPVHAASAASTAADDPHANKQ